MQRSKTYNSFRSTNKGACLLRDLPLAPAIDDPWNAAADDCLLEAAVTFCALFAHINSLELSPNTGDKFAHCGSVGLLKQATTHCGFFRAPKRRLLTRERGAR
jgi:hypothetical protein